MSKCSEWVQFPPSADLPRLARLRSAPLWGLGKAAPAQGRGKEPPGWSPRSPDSESFQGDLNISWGGRLSSLNAIIHIPVVFVQEVWLEMPLTEQYGIQTINNCKAFVFQKSFFFCWLKHSMIDIYIRATVAHSCLISFAYCRSLVFAPISPRTAVPFLPLLFAQRWACVHFLPRIGPFIHIQGHTH